MWCGLLISKERKDERKLLRFTYGVQKGFFGIVKLTHQITKLVVDKH